MEFDQPLRCLDTLVERSDVPFGGALEVGVLGHCLKEFFAHGFNLTSGLCELNREKVPALDRLPQTTVVVPRAVHQLGSESFDLALSLGELHPELVGSMALGAQLFRNIKLLLQLVFQNRILPPQENASVCRGAAGAAMKGVGGYRPVLVRASSL